MNDKELTESILWHIYVRSGAWMIKPLKSNYIITAFDHYNSSSDPYRVLLYGCMLYRSRCGSIMDCLGSQEYSLISLYMELCSNINFISNGKQLIVRRMDQFH